MEDGRFRAEMAIEYAESWVGLARDVRADERLSKSFRQWRFDARLRKALQRLRPIDPGGELYQYTTDDIRARAEQVWREVAELGSSEWP